jgi:hypothetical protein
MDPAITKVHVFPDYSSGFVFMWEVDGSFNMAPPWIFRVEESVSVSGPWVDISGPIFNSYMFKARKHPLINKSNVMYFRVVLTAGENTYFSHVVQPYGDLGKKDFLIARDIMRKETLHMKGFAGVACRLYTVSTFGPPCVSCRDPITGEIRDADCRKCFGTGRLNPYSGPYETWMSFSSDMNHDKIDEGLGTFEPKVFEVRIVANPVVKKNDIIVDIGSDKRYYVNKAKIVAEIRRVPIVQTLEVSEAPVSDKIYSIH